MSTKHALLCGLLPLLIFALLLASCTSEGTTGAQTTPTATALAQLSPTMTPTSTPDLTPCPANQNPPGVRGEPTLPPSGWTTFTDTQLHYTIQYPANWIVPNGPCSGKAFSVANHLPIPASGGRALPPGGFIIDVVPIPNPSHLSTAAFAASLPTLPGAQPCAGAYTLVQVQVGEHETVLATCPEGSRQPPTEGDSSQGDTYIVSLPNGETMLAVVQLDLVDGQPSPILAQMVASITFLPN
jgi:hypothetical protein